MLSFAFPGGNVVSAGRVLFKTGVNVMGHQESYQHNEAYAEFLSGWDIHFYSKYIDTLTAGVVSRQDSSAAARRVLDAGCGVGQVVLKLKERGFSAYGVDVSESNIARASKHSPECVVYDGHHLPFEDGFFDAAGALNVLEHVEEPEEFLRELVRVVKPGGRLVVSSPNFLRVLGFRDYHPRMRGIGNKLHNWQCLRQLRRQIRRDPDSVRFERMPPIVKEPFTPDDDAIVVTNPLLIRFFLERYGCRVGSVVCTDRYVNPLAEFCLNATPLRYVMFNGFVTATKL